MEPRRDCTIRIHFGAGSRKPSDEEVFRFFRKQKWSCEDLIAMYREDHNLMVQFKSEDLMQKELLRLGVRNSFVYGDGTKVNVSVSDAKETFSYVRIFGLPPQVEDNRIIEAMEKFGKVHELCRERYPKETGYPILNGVRGVVMVVHKEISSIIQIQGINARIYYDGIKNKCFTCGSIEHLKTDCTKLMSSKERLVSSTPKNECSFSNIVKNGYLASQPNKVDMVDSSENDLGNIDVILENPENNTLSMNLKERRTYNNKDIDHLEKSLKEDSLQETNRIVQECNNTNNSGISSRSEKNNTSKDKAKTSNKEWTPEEIKRS